MYILINACQHPEVLRLLYFATIILDIITVIIPIGLILMLLIDFTKAVISSSADEQIKSTKVVTKRIMYAVIVFMVPWIVDLLMLILANAGVNVGTDYTECLTNARSGNFAYYEQLLNAEEAIDDINNNRYPNQSGNSYLSSGTKYEEAASQLIENAKAELGTVGGSKYSGRSSSVAWCAYFVKWNMENVIIDGTGTLYDYHLNGKQTNSSYGAYVGDFVSTFYKNSNLEFYNSKHYGGNYTPKKGDIIFFWWLSKSHDYTYWDKTESEAIHASHIGIVEYVKNGNVYVIEGNAGGLKSELNSVMEKTYSLNSDRIMGYGSWYK